MIRISLNATTKNCTPHPRGSRHGQKKSSRSCPLTPKQQKDINSHPPTTSSKLNTSHGTTQTSSPIATHPSSTTAVSNSTPVQYQPTNTSSPGRSARTEIDLLEISAWASLYENVHRTDDTFYQLSDHSQMSACLYHTAFMSSAQNIIPSVYGMGPIERWYNEDMNDRGRLALQLEQQLGAECTCVAGQTIGE